MHAAAHVMPSVKLCSAHQDSLSASNQPSDGWRACLVTVGLGLVHLALVLRIKPGCI